MRGRFGRASQGLTGLGLANAEALPALSSTQEALEKLSTLGYIVEPGSPLSSLVVGVGRDNPRLLLGEGIYQITKTLVLSQPVQLISLAPGRTTIERATDFAGPMIQITANDVYLQGITLDNSDRSQTTIDVHGSHTTIDGCLFLGFDTAIHAYTSASGLRPAGTSIINNRFRGPGFDTGVVGGDGLNILSDAIILDTGNTILVSGNHFSEWLTGFSDDTRAVDSAAAVGTTAFTSNVAHDSIIRYKGGVGNVDSGNVATVQVF